MARAYARKPVAESLNKIQADLKGADFNKKLIWKTNEGFDVMPFYMAKDIENLKLSENIPGKFPYVRGAKPDNKWFVRQEIVVENGKPYLIEI